MEAAPEEGSAVKLLRGHGDLYSENCDIRELFGDLEGALLVEAIFGIYGDEKTVDGRSPTTTIPWFAVDGSRNVVRHKANRDIQESVCEAYIKRILESGLQVDVAGAPWLQWSEGRAPPARAITFNHRAEAFYRAKALAPDNLFVQGAQNLGLVGCRMLSARTPSPIIRYLMAYHNSFHGGSGVSFLEMGTEAVEVETKWKAACQNTGIQ